MEGMHSELACASGKGVLKNSLLIKYVKEVEMGKFES